MAKPEDPIQRSVLPIPDVTPIGLTTFDAKDPDTKYPPIRPIHPPAGAPNVLVILIDDAGFGSSSAVGSTHGSTPPRCAHRRARRSSAAATTTRWGWARSPNSRRPPLDRIR